MDEHQRTPRYLIVIFVGILAIIGLGIWQKVSHRSSPVVLGAYSENISSKTTPPIVKFLQLPTPIANLSNPYIGARNATLIDDEAKYVLYSQAHTDQVPIASITKVMTAVLVIDNNRLNDYVSMTADDIRVVGSNLGLSIGEQLKVSDLLKALLIRSSNEAANALARATSGSVEKFVDNMNKRARDMGLKKTSYGDPHGLSPESKSTAYEQAILFSYALHYPLFREIIGTGETTITSLDGKVHTLANSNRLITNEMHFDGLIGGKTGYTPEAGHCLVTAAARNNRTIVSVILNTASPLNTASAVESKKLLDWGFASYTWPLN